MIHSSKSCLIVLSLVCLAACQDVSSEEASARAIFSNYTSGLLALTTVNSTTYSLFSLIVGGAALAIAIGYLYSTSPAFQDTLQGQFQSHYRSFQEDPSSTLRKFSEMDGLVGLVAKAFSIYSKLNEDDEE